MTNFELVKQFQQLQEYLIRNLSQLDDSALALLYDQSRKFSYVAESIRNELRGRCAMRGSICGWHLVRQRGARELRNPELVYNTLQDVLKREEFFSCCSTSIPKLQELYVRRRRELVPQMNEGESTREFLDRIAPLITRKPDVQLLKNVAERPY